MMKTQKENEGKKKETTKKNDGNMENEGKKNRMTTKNDEKKKEE